MNLELKEKNLERIKKYVEEGRYNSIDEFIEKAVETLLYAEDRKEEFMKMLGKQMSSGDENTNSQKEE